MNQLEEITRRLDENTPKLSGIELTDEQKEMIQRFLDRAQEWNAAFAERLNKLVNAVNRNIEHILWQFEFYQDARAEHSRDHALMQAARRQWIRLE